MLKSTIHEPIFRFFTSRPARIWIRVWSAQCACILSTFVTASTKGPSTKMVASSQILIHLCSVFYSAAIYRILFSNLYMCPWNQVDLSTASQLAWMTFLFCFQFLLYFSISNVIIIDNNGNDACRVDERVRERQKRMYQLLILLFNCHDLFSHIMRSRPRPRSCLFTKQWMAIAYYTMEQAVVQPYFVHRERWYIATRRH